MLSIVKRLINLSGKYKKRLIAAIIVAFFEGIATLSPSFIVMFTVYKISENKVGQQDVGLISVFIGLALLLKMLLKRVVDGLQLGTGFEIFADERMKMGDHLKRLPMGYFSSDAIGNITSTLTADLSFVEGYGMTNMSVIVNAYINMVLSVVIWLVLDWRLGLIIAVTYLLSLFALNEMNKTTEKLSNKRQQGIAKLVGSVIEYIKGISIIKAFNMQCSKKINQAFEQGKNDAIEFENAILHTYVVFQNILAFGIGGIIYFASYLGITNSLNVSFVLMILIFVFQIFNGIVALVSVAPIVRMMEAGLNRYDDIMKVAVLDDDGQDIRLEKFDIQMKDVSFAYETHNVLENINITIPEKSMMALVGKSGCGKTTITNLIARFWDVKQGEVIVGGVNVKKMTCDSLLKNISMVFQNVYLFNDTLLNNIKFAKSDATMEEVIDACKKARCYDFIMALEDGFETMIVESGSSLSGGEKQRRSIARALLKDAPIILLDEATANVDPDNEVYIQEAIDEVVRNKTLVVIAHKLSTIKKADSIIVLEEGKIIESGRHGQLIDDKKYYYDFWQKREKSRGWQIVKAK